MPSILKVRPGVYVQISTQDSSGTAGSALITIEDLLDNEVLLVTQFTFSQSARVQYKPTLGGSVYVYPLGDNMGEIKISGLAAFSGCTDASQGGEGFQKLADFYASKKASKVKNVLEPIKIVLPGLENYTTNCFLETLSISGVDPKNMVFGYELGFKVAPADN